jgi:TRAP transporter 4TM/12TM fusion protein
MHRLINALAMALPLGTVVWAADLFREIGMLVYPEQFLAGMLGIGTALVFLTISAGGKRRREGSVPWYDLLLAGVSFGLCAYMAWKYPTLSINANLPADGLIVALVMMTIFMEGARRTSGWGLVLTGVGFIALSLAAHVLPESIRGREIPFDRLMYYLVWDPSALFGSSMQIIAITVVSFVFFGQALFLSGAGAFFTDIAMALMGRFRGGPAKIAIVGSSLFGMISGSAIANVVTVGVVSIPLMKQGGYRPQSAAAIESVGSTGGQLMPPVMGVVAFVMAEYLQVPYAAVAMAAILPAALYYVSLFVQADLEAAKFGLARLPEDQIPSKLAVIKNGWYIPAPFVVLIGGIFFFRWQLEESALISMVIVLLMGLFVGYKGHKLKLSGIAEVLRTTGLSVLDLIMVAPIAGIIIGGLNVSGLGFGFALSLVALAGGSVILLLLLSAVANVVLGLGLPTLACYILLAVLVCPALIHMGIDPMAAHLFTLYYGMLSAITPPVAGAVFAASSIAGSDFMKTGWAAMRFGWCAFLIPFLFTFSGSLLLRGDPTVIVIDFVTAVAGIWFVCAAMVGFALRPISPATRVIYGIAGLALLCPLGMFEAARWVTIAGAVVGAALLFMEFTARRRAVGIVEART